MIQLSNKIMHSFWFEFWFRIHSGSNIFWLWIYSHFKGPHKWTFRIKFWPYTSKEGHFYETWQPMCKNLKKNLKINFLYLTRAPTTRPAAPAFSPHTSTKTSSAAERNSGVEGSNTGVEGQSLVRGSGDGFSSGKI